MMVYCTLPSAIISAFQRRVVQTPSCPPRVDLGSATCKRVQDQFAKKIFSVTLYASTRMANIIGGKGLPFLDDLREVG